MSHKSTDLTQNYDMTMKRSADIVWKRAVCVADKRELNFHLTDASKYDWILWQYGPGEKTRQEYFLGLGNSYAWHRKLEKALLFENGYRQDIWKRNRC